MNRTIEKIGDKKFGTNEFIIELDEKGNLMNIMGRCKAKDLKKHFKKLKEDLKQNER